MLKNTILATAFAVLLAQAGQAQPIQAQLDGRPLRFDQPPIMVGGSVLVPLRGIFESLGADVRYEAATQIIRASRGPRLVQLTLGSSEASVDGQPVHLDSPARTVGGSTMVPLRFVSEALGAQVRWISATRTVVLNSPDGNPTANVNPPPPAALPTISSVIHNARGPLSPGDRLVVSMTGDPGGQASFEILGTDIHVPMRETNAGSYEGEMVVPRDLRIRQGTLVAHLRREGRDAMLEASRPVTMAAHERDRDHDQAPPPGPALVWQVQPPQGAFVDTPRPRVEVRLDGRATPNGVRFIFDGTDVTPYTQIRGREMVFQPQIDLAPGNHVAQVFARDGMGAEQSQRWNFNVSGGPRPRSMEINLTNLGPGAYVPPVFNVQGQTAPYSSVTVRAEGSRTLIPGVMNMQGRVLTASAMADASGHFDLQFDATQAPRNSQLLLKVQATDRDGHQGPVRTVEVVLR